MDFFHFICNTSISDWKKQKGFSNIYNNHDKAYRGISPFFIWNNYIYGLKIQKLSSNHYNNYDKLYHGFIIIFYLE
jgi:hypothetical protein